MIIRFGLSRAAEPRHTAEAGANAPCEIVNRYGPDEAAVGMTGADQILNSSMRKGT